MGNVLNEDFQDFLKALNACDVRYVLVGGYSVIYHGFPRTTGDMDLFVEVSQKNYEKICKAFRIFGMPVFDMTEESFLFNKEVNVYSFGRSPVSIEILKGISGLTFDVVFKNSISAKIEGIEIRIINLSDLVKNKKASGRPKDINDVNNLE